MACSDHCRAEWAEIQYLFCLSGCVSDGTTLGWGKELSVEWYLLAVLHTAHTHTHTQNVGTFSQFVLSAVRASCPTRTDEVRPGLCDFLYSPLWVGHRFKVRSLSEVAWVSSSHTPLLGAWSRTGFDQGWVLVMKGNELGEGYYAREWL
jgi:hypothetical protein